MDSPPLPLPVGSPVWATKPGWTVWNKLGRVKNEREFFGMICLPAVVSLVLAKLEKIEASFRPLLQVQVNCEVTNCGLYHHRHVVGGLWKVHSLINLDDLTYRIYISLAVERKPTETL